MPFYKEVASISVLVGLVSIIWMVTRKRTKTSKIYEESIKRQELVITIIGANKSGKTTLFQSLINTISNVQTEPYYGYNTAKFLIEGTRCKLYDIEEERTDYLRFLNARDINIIIYVLDSTATSEIPRCSEDVKNILRNWRFKDAKIIIAASKQDAWSALYIKQIPYLLKVKNNRRVTYTSALNTQEIINIIARCI